MAAHPTSLPHPHPHSHGPHPHSASPHHNLSDVATPIATDSSSSSSATGAGAGAAGAGANGAIDNRPPGAAPRRPPPLPLRQRAAARAAAEAAARMVQAEAAARSYQQAVDMAATTGAIPAPQLRRQISGSSATSDGRASAASSSNTSVAGGRGVEPLSFGEDAFGGSSGDRTIGDATAAASYASHVRRQSSGGTIGGGPGAAGGGAMDPFGPLAGMGSPKPQWTKTQKRRTDLTAPLGGMGSPVPTWPKGRHQPHMAEAFGGGPLAGMGSPVPNWPKGRNQPHMAEAFGGGPLAGMGSPVPNWAGGSRPAQASSATGTAVNTSSPFTLADPYNARRIEELSRTSPVHTSTPPPVETDGMQRAPSPSHASHQANSMSPTTLVHAILNEKQATITDLARLLRERDEQIQTVTAELAHVEEMAGKYIEGAESKIAFLESRLSNTPSHMEQPGVPADVQRYTPDSVSRQMSELKSETEKLVRLLQHREQELMAARATITDQQSQIDYWKRSCRALEDQLMRLTPASPKAPAPLSTSQPFHRSSSSQV